MKFRRRAPALFGIFALALLQVSFASHQFQHVADHGFGVCHSCTAYNQVDDAPIPDTPPTKLSAELNVAIEPKTYSFTAAPVSRAYQPRAPPHS